MREKEFLFIDWFVLDLKKKSNFFSAL